MSRFVKLRRMIALAPLGLLVSGALGCGTGRSFTHQDDPLLGNFNRPITPTPPPTGSDIGGVWAGGPGIYAAPAISNNVVPYVPGQAPPLPGVVPNEVGATGYNLPNSGTTNASLAGGKGAKATISNFFNPSDSESASKVPTQIGTTISLQNRFQQPANPEARPIPQAQPWDNDTDPNTVQFRQPGTSVVTRGSAIIPDTNAMPNQTPLTMPGQKLPSQITTIEEGQQILSAHGVKWQRLEKIENGDWQFTCAVSSNPNATQAKQYSARHPDQIQALKAVVEQVSRDR